MSIYNLVVGILLLIYGVLMLLGVISGSIVYAIAALVLGLWGIMTGVKKGGKKTPPISAPPPTTPPPAE